MAAQLSRLINGGLPRLSGGLDLLPSRDRFRRTLERERERADRSGSFFSLLVLAMDAEEFTERALHDVVKHVLRRTRSVDEIGWFDTASIGVILPYTSSDGAQRLAEELHGRVSLLGTGLSYRIYSYPSR